MRKTTPFRIDKSNIAYVKEINSMYTKKGVQIINMTMGLSSNYKILPSMYFEQGFCTEFDSETADIQAGLLLNSPKKYPIYFCLTDTKVMLEFRGQYHKDAWITSKVYFYIPTETESSESNKRILWGSLLAPPEHVTENTIANLIKMCQERAITRFIT